MVPDFELSSPVAPASVAGSRAVTYEYTGQPGTPVHVKIVIAEFSGGLYLISYMARDEQYEDHLAQVDSILSSLRPSLSLWRRRAPLSMRRGRSALHHRLHRGAG